MRVTPTGSGHKVALRASEVSYSWEASRNVLWPSQGRSCPHPGLSSKAASAWGDATGRGSAPVSIDGAQASAALGPSCCFQVNAQRGSRGSPCQVQTGVQRFEWAWGTRLRLQGPGSSARFEVPAVLCPFFFFGDATACLVGSQFPDQGLRPTSHPPTPHSRVLITGPQGNSLSWTWVWVDSSSW